MTPNFEILINSYLKINSDTSYWLSDIYFLYASASTYYEIDVNLTCSLSGNSIISNSFCSDEGYEIPTWISLDEANSKLIVNTPALNQPTNFTFTLKAVTSEKSYPVYRKVYIQVSWWVTDCKFWESNSNSRCSQWANGYQVYSNSKTCESSSVDSTADASSKLTISAISAGMGLFLKYHIEHWFTLPIANLFLAACFFVSLTAFFPSPFLTSSCFSVTINSTWQVWLR